MKKRPVKKYEKETGRKPIVGTMACESVLRQTMWFRNGCNSFDAKRPMSRPLSFWTEQDILQYIVEYNLEIASVYGEIKTKPNPEPTLFGDEKPLYYTTGLQRTGCMFCMYGVQLEPHPNRFEIMKETHPKQYDYCTNRLGLGKVLDYIHVKH